MKTTTLIIGVLMLGATTAAAAGDSPFFERLGVKTGLSFSSQVGGFYDFVRDKGGQVESRTGIALGVFGEIPLHERFSIESEMSYSQRGVRIPEENGVRKRELDLSYAEFSAIGKLKLPLQSMTPFITTGPVLGVLGGATGRVGDHEQSIRDELSGVDFALAFGGGITRGPIGIELRYLIGLTDIVLDEDVAKNRGLSVLMSYELYPR
jgi:hypothetical protein